MGISVPVIAFYILFSLCLRIFLLHVEVTIFSDLNVRIFVSEKVNRKNTIYEIQASIGKINVVGNGKWYNINCKEGDKLFCFQLRTIDQKLKLTSGKFLF